MNEYLARTSRMEDKGGLKGWEILYKMNITSMRSTNL